MSKLQVSNHSDRKYNIISDDTLTQIQTKLLPLLNNALNVTLLKKLIGKYEKIGDSEIGSLLYAIRKFKPITQHKIRDFINRAVKTDRGCGATNNSEKSFPYQSDNSNIISPSSRESFLSRSDYDISHLQAEVIRLWQYSICQREICQLLNDNNDLEVRSSRSVAIDFQQLRPESLDALNNYLSVKSPLIDEIQRDEELRILFPILSTEILPHEIEKQIYDILLRYEKIAPNPNGLRSIKMTSLTRETKKALCKLLRPLSTTNNGTPTLSSGIGSGSGSSSTVVTPLSEKSATKGLSTNKPPQNSIESHLTPQYGPFTKEHHKFITANIYERMHDARLVDVMNIVRLHENMDAKDDAINVKKLKDVTKHFLCKFFTDNDGTKKE